MRAGRIPRTVWALGMVSLFMDFSSELIHALLPVYLVTVLGASALTVGFIEGVAEATASITKLFSGVLSDRLGQRKRLAVIGYGLAAATKPIFALASTVAPVVGARFLDRIGKGIRGAPRDALIADVTPPHLRGASFGLRQSMDTIGAVLGPLAAMALMTATGGAYRTVFWIAVVPAIIAMAFLVLGVREPATPIAQSGKVPPRLADIARIGGRFRAVLVVATLLTLARFSEAFLILRARDLGMRVALVPIVLVVMNVVYALSAYPAGVLADRIGRRRILGVGIACLIVADVVLALGTTTVLLLVGTACWGLHLGLTQSLFATLVADTAPPHLRGSAFGVLNLVTGVAMLAASVMAGALWDAHGPSATFLTGAAFTTIALAGMLLIEADAPPGG